MDGWNVRKKIFFIMYRVMTKKIAGRKKEKCQTARCHNNWTKMDVIKGYGLVIGYYVFWCSKIVWTKRFSGGMGLLCWRLRGFHTHFFCLLLLWTIKIYKRVYTKKFQLYYYDYYTIMEHGTTFWISRIIKTYSPHKLEKLIFQL